jgi:hypothetical protein
MLEIAMALNAPPVITWNAGANGLPVTATSHVDMSGVGHPGFRPLSNRKPLLTRYLNC